MSSRVPCPELTCQSGQGEHLKRFACRIQGRAPLTQKSRPSSLALPRAIVFPRPICFRSGISDDLVLLRVLEFFRGAQAYTSNIAGHKGGATQLQVLMKRVQGGVLWGWRTAPPPGKENEKVARALSARLAGA